MAGKRAKGAAGTPNRGEGEDGAPTKKRSRPEGERKGRAAGREERPRRLRRAAEEAEIKALEARIAIEAPPVGRAGAAGAPGAGTPDSAGSGPALTSKLFADLPVSDRTKKGLRAAKYIKMTEIQRDAIPRALCGRDILGEARTGSGKTLAFLVPTIELLFRRRWTQLDGLGALVISPTKELAYQIFQVLTNIGGEHDLSAGCVVGGRSLEDEQQAVANMNLLVATPGRLLQHLDESPGFEASGLLMLVVDEADRILDFGFQETVHHILGHLPATRQSLLFSATLRAGVQRLGRAALRSPEVVSVHQDAKSRTPDKLKQVYMVVPLEQKVDFLFSFLRAHSQKKLIVFVSSCKQVRFLYEAFRKLKPGPAVVELHGRQSLTKRLMVFKEFTERDHAVALLCTDVAARGVDFPAVDWVVQMDCPDTVDSYIHRVGRTARYHSSGHSALFLLPSEEAFAAKLAAARVRVRSISAKSGKLVCIRHKLSSLLASEGAIKHLAQKAFASYVRSLHLMKDKEVFNPKDLPLQAFAESLGLVDVPDLGALGGDADLEENPLKKRKNQSALQRLKDKIRQKKEARAAGAVGGAGAGAGAGASAREDAGADAEGPEEELGSKKLGRWERRMRKIARLGGPAAAAAAAAAPAARAAADEEDELLRPVETGVGADGAAKPVPPVQTAARRNKLKIRKDGVDVGAQGRHTFFTEAGAEASTQLAQLAEELRGDGFAGSGEAGREAFIARVARNLAKRDASDAAVSRARIYERHQKEKRRDKEERRAEGGDAEEPVFELATPSGSEAEPEAAASSGDEGGAPAPAEKARPGRPDVALVGAKRRKVAFAHPRASPVEEVGGDDGLGALERQALGRLGAGLFS